jgi:hypothetical protein
MEIMHVKMRFLTASSCGRSGCILQQVLLLFGQGEQRFALSGGQEFTAGHETNLTMNYAFEKPLLLALSRLSDPPLSLDEDNNSPPRLADRDDWTPDSLQFHFSSG